MAQISQCKAAEKNMYPTISLTGLTGLETLSTGRFFTNDAYFYTIAPTITWPVFNAGEMQYMFSAEDACVTSEGQKIISLINLFKAPGGGWEPLR